MDFRLIIIFAISLFIALYHSYKHTYLKNCKKLELSGLGSIFLSVGAIISSLDLIRLACISDELREILGPDTLILVLGSAAVIWISITEVFKLFKDQNQ